MLYKSMFQTYGPGTFHLSNYFHLYLQIFPTSDLLLTINRWKSGNSDRFYFLGLQNQNSDCNHEIKRCLLLGRKAMKNLDSILKSRDITLPIGLNSQRYGFSSSHVRIWALDHKEGWVPKNWFFQIVMLEKTLESPLDNKEIKPVNPKGNQPWIFIGRADTAAEPPILRPPDAKS